MRFINWIELISGVWIVISPWVLGFSGFSFIVWSNVIVGAFVVVFAIWSLFGGEKPAAPSGQ